MEFMPVLYKYFNQLPTEAKEEQSYHREKKTESNCLLYSVVVLKI